MADPCRTIEENKARLSYSYALMLSGERKEFERTIDLITGANIKVLAQQAPYRSHNWDPNWLNGYKEKIAPNLEKCAKAALAGKESILAILKEDRELGNWTTTAIGRDKKGKEVSIPLPYASNYPNPFSPKGPLHTTRYLKYNGILEEKLKKHLPKDLPFLGAYLASYLLDAPLHAYEAITLKENDATPA